MQCMQNARKDLGMIFQKIRDLHAILKRWGFECKDFEKLEAFMQGFWETEGLNAILQNAGFKMQIFKITMHQNES